MTINADITRRVHVKCSGLEWMPSPSRSVLRKRYYLAGPAESGQVTSLVRYLPGARFPEHGHPEGEEILVLEGIFTDEGGNWPAGSWLLNPEGYRHSPSSDQGCLLFVKLRQYTGTLHKVIEVGKPGWRQAGENHYTRLDEYGCVRTGIMTLPPGGRLVLPSRRGTEGFVLDGSVTVWDETLSRYDWFRAPPEQELVIDSGGCSLYLTEDGVADLMSVA